MGHRYQGGHVVGLHRGLLPGSLAFAVPDLDELNSGTVHLSVPLLDDVIQVGVGGNPMTGKIQVSKVPIGVTVRRTDGKPMQAQILHRHRRCAASSMRVTVFREPVDRLRLHRVSSGDGRWLWLAAEAWHVDRHRDLQQFVATIATFGLAKQRRLPRSEMSHFHQATSTLEDLK